MLGAHRPEEPRSTRTLTIQLGAIALFALALYFALNFLVPLSTEYMSLAPAGLAARLPFWQAVMGLPLPVPQSPTDVILVTVGSSALLVICYTLALRVVRKVAAASASVLVLVVAGMGLFYLTSLLSMPNSSSDIYLYMMYARVLDVHHANPFTAWPASFPADPYLTYVPSAWQYTSSLYGPIWTFLCVITGRLAGGDIVRDLLDLRLVLLGLNLANAALIWRVVGRLRPSYRLTALVFYGWNPIVILQGLGHVEPLIVFFVLLSAALYQSARPWLGFAGVALSAITKFATAPLLVVSLFATFRSRYLKFLLVAGVAMGTLVVFMLPGNLFGPRRLVFLPVFLGVVAWVCAQQMQRGSESREAHFEHMLRGWAVVMFASSFLMMPNEYDWYLIPLVAVAGLMAWTRIATLTVVLSLSGALNWVLSDTATFYMEPSSWSSTFWLFRLIWYVPTVSLLVWLYRSEIAGACSAVAAWLVAGKHAPRARDLWTSMVQGNGMAHHSHARYIYRPETGLSQQTAQAGQTQPQAVPARTEPRM